MTTDEKYKDLIRELLHQEERGDRTGTGTLSVFGRSMRFDLSQGFPLLTTKRVPFRLVAGEIAWMLRGETNVIPLIRQDIHIWTDWAFQRFARHQGSDRLMSSNGRWHTETDIYKSAIKEFEEQLLDGVIDKSWGELGPIYGKQWRRFNGVDQIDSLVNEIKNNPNSRRMLVSAWNPNEVPSMALPPCHWAFQCYVSDGKLSLMWHQRSVDVFLGLPFNIAGYAFLTHALAHVTGLEPGDLIFTGGDCHLYSNHTKQAMELLSRDAKPSPRLVRLRDFNLMTLDANCFELDGYAPAPAIKAPVAV